MMKFKYLTDNRELALHILNNWEYDMDQLEIMDQFRISATAIYPFWKDDALQYLRFSPCEERTAECVGAELEFINYLRNNGFPVAQIVSSKDGEDLNEINTKWGHYIASVFKRVDGNRLDRVELSDDILFNLGSTLAQLHKLSGEYEPKGCRRESHTDKLNWIDETLEKYDNKALAKKESKLIREQLNTLSKTSLNYGLVHYDYEFDNLFFDETSKKIHVIDFDDAVYHWYVMDLIKFYDCLSDEYSGSSLDAAIKQFNNGYKSIREVDEDLLKMQNLFERYDALYSYTRCLEAISDPAEDQEEWMGTLRKRIEGAMSRKSQCFGQDIR